jgi:hypothetical protein
MQHQSYILRIYLGPIPFQPLSLLTTVNWGATMPPEMGRNKCLVGAFMVDYVRWLNRTLKINKLTMAKYGFVSQEGSARTAVTQLGVTSTLPSSSLA